jgi:hypothetical protein
MRKLKPIDKKGREIHQGDWVRVVDLPESLSNAPSETKTVLKKSKNKTFRVESFGKYGHIELEVWRKLKLKTMDSIWIEPFCVVRSRLKKSL